MDASLLDIVEGPDGNASRWMMLGLTGVRTDGTVIRWASRRDGSIVRTTDREPKSSIFHAVQSLVRVL
jgi:hypothetical protein